MTADGGSSRGLRIGVLGLAFSNPYTFARILRARGVSMAAVWDYYPDQAAAYAEEFDAQVVEAPEDMAALGLDGVLVESTNADHCRLARPMVAAGIPVYLDKVFALDEREADDLLTLAEERGTFVMAGSSLRFGPAFKTLADRVRDGGVGTPILASSFVSHTMADYLADPRKRWHDRLDEGGGMLVDIGVHGVEVLLQALGPGVVSVAAQTSKVRYQEADSEDCAVLTLTFRSGAIGVLHLSCASDLLDYTLTVHGTEGPLDAQDIARELYGAGTAAHSESAERALDAFVEAIVTQTPPMPRDELMEEVRVLLAARRAATERRVISL